MISRNLTGDFPKIPRFTPLPFSFKISFGKRKFFQNVMDLYTYLEDSLSPTLPKNFLLQKCDKILEN